MSSDLCGSRGIFTRGGDGDRHTDLEFLTCCMINTSGKVDDNMNRMIHHIATDGQCLCNDIVLRKLHACIMSEKFCSQTPRHLSWMCILCP